MTPFSRVKNSLMWWDYTDYTIRDYTYKVSKMTAFTLSLLDSGTADRMTLLRLLHLITAYIGIPILLYREKSISLWWGFWWIHYQGVHAYYAQKIKAIDHKYKESRTLPTFFHSVSRWNSLSVSPSVIPSVCHSVRSSASPPVCLSLMLSPRHHLNRTFQQMKTIVLSDIWMEKYAIILIMHINVFYIQTLTLTVTG